MGNETNEYTSPDNNVLRAGEGTGAPSSGADGPKQRGFCGGGWYNISVIMMKDDKAVQKIEGVHYIADKEMLRALTAELQEKAIDFSIIPIEDSKFKGLKDLVPKLMLLAPEE